MISSKIHVHNTERILAACDEEILGLTFKGDGMKITVSEGFYKGELISEETFIERTKSVTIMNLVGNKIVDLAISEGLVSSDNVIIIGDVKHAQAVIF